MMAVVWCSIRLMFSIADIQSQQENDFDEAENEEGAEEQASPSYPIRCSFSITKVRL